MVHLILEDGRGLWLSTVAMTGVYSLISAAVDNSHPKLKRWLADVSQRPVPFMDLDIRGLPEDCQTEFHRAAKVAWERLAERVETGELSPDATKPIEQLVRMKESMDRGEPPLSLSGDDQVGPFRGQVYDLDEIWFE
jgi:hypothetical protein